MATTPEPLRRLPGSKRGHDDYLSSIPDEGLDSESPEVKHQYQLDQAYLAHESVRKRALKIMRNQQLLEEEKRLQAENEREAERIRLEAEVARKRRELIELQQKSIPVPEMPPTPTPPPKPPKPEPAEEEEVPPAASGPLSTSGELHYKAVGLGRPAAELQPPNPTTTPFPPPPSQPFEPAQPAQAPTASLPTPAPSIPIPTPHVTKPAAAPPSSAAPDALLPGTQRYVEIHQNLKALRKFITDAGKSSPPLKKQIGEIRRSIRKSVGQISTDVRANAKPRDDIIQALMNSLRVPAPPYDPANIVVDAGPPQDANNPKADWPSSLFIYALNIFAKSICGQFISEAGIDTKKADPISIIGARVFATPQFTWRGQSLIDILLCKFRVTCPVLFGLRGNEKTEEGRARIGWQKLEGQWVNEALHAQRTTGLAAGFAAVALRNFANAATPSPMPPVWFWRALSSLANTESKDAGDTVFIALKALLDGNEARVLRYWGNAGKAALRIALVDFPERVEREGEKEGPRVPLRSIKPMRELMRRAGLNLVG
jgi:nucleoporin GLE1